MLRLEIKPDKRLAPGFDAFLKQFAPAVDNALLKNTGYAKGLIVKETAKGRTGLTHGGWFSKKLAPLIYLIWNKFAHALYLETGTGVFGPRGAPITPTQAEWLVFPIFENGGNTPTSWVKTKSVQGMPAQPMIAPNMGTIRNDLTIRIQNMIRRLWKEVYA
jgi:hypothetical protein